MYKVIARNLANGTKRAEALAASIELAWFAADFFFDEGARSVTVKPL